MAARIERADLGPASQQFSDVHVQRGNLVDAAVQAVFVGKTNAKDLECSQSLLGRLKPRADKEGPQVPSPNSICGKITHVWERFKYRWGRCASELTLIGGDVFTTGYLGFQGVTTLIPSTASLAGMSLSTLICGEVGGAINLFVAIICIVEGVQKIKNSGWKWEDEQCKDGVRMVVEGLLLLAVGSLMIVGSLAIKVGALAAVGSIVTNPYIMSTLFFALSIGLIWQLYRAEKSIWQGKDVGTQLLNQAKAKAIAQNGGIVDELFNVPEQYISQEAIATYVNDKVEQWQGEIGIEAALAACNVWRAILKHDMQLAERKELENTINELEKKIQEWRTAIHTRTVQQIVYTLGFVLGLVALAPVIAVGALIAINATNDFAMALANLIPAYMDAFWPFKRNTQAVPEKLQDADVADAVERILEGQSVTLPMSPPPLDSGMGSPEEGAVA